MTSHRPPTRTSADRTRPRVWGPSGHMGPVMREGANSAKKPATVSATDVAARATGWQSWESVRVRWFTSSRPIYVVSMPRGVPAPPGRFRRADLVQHLLVKLTGAEVVK